MKKPILPFFGILLLFSLASCKKKYTCSCNTNATLKASNGGYVSQVMPGSKTQYTEKMTQKQAKEACKHEEDAIQSDFTNGWTGNGQSPLLAGESIVTSCSIIL